MENKLQIKIEQIAFASPNPQNTKKLLSSLMGMGDWTEDQVTTKGFLLDEDGKDMAIENTANLSFNYSGGIEFEVLQYIDGPNWLEERCKPIPNAPWPVLSHIGMHCTDKELEHWMVVMSAANVQILQDVTTISHTNPFLLETGRQYRYVIFGTEELLGFDFKLIVRIPGDNEPQPAPKA